jgi:hypothetical protein
VLFALNIHLMEMKFKTEAGDCDMPWAVLRTACFFVVGR